MTESTGATPVPAGAALLYLDVAAGKQRLWVKFDDGSFTKIAESTA